MKLRFVLDESANKFKPGEWIEGNTDTEPVTGMYISTISKQWDLIATWKKVGKIRRKQYIQISESQKTKKPKDAPSDIKKFAKKNSMWWSKK